MCLKSLQKYSLRLNAASHNNASWYTDTHGFLERLPSGGSLKYQGHALQKIVLDILGGVPPLVVLILQAKILLEDILVYISSSINLV